MNAPEEQLDASLFVFKLLVRLTLPYFTYVFQTLSLFLFLVCMTMAVFVTHLL